MPVIGSDFRSPWWLNNRHLQTLYPTFFRQRLKLPIQTERLELDDGDFLDLAHCHQDGCPQAIILHGLEGSLNSHYATPLIAALRAAGFSVTFLHARGCSGEPNRLPRRYHSGETRDLHHVLQTLSTRDESVTQVVVGISLGGNILLKYLGEGQVVDSLAAAVAISVPFDLANAAATLQTGFARIYQKHLLNRLVNATRKKFNTMPPPFDMSLLDKMTTLYEFDDVVTGPLHGFRDADDYYTQSSSRQYLGNIELPTHIIHAADDPFMTSEAIPSADELSDSVTLELLNSGGHVGFVDGFKPDWLETRVAEILREDLSTPEPLRTPRIV